MTSLAYLPDLSGVFTMPAFAATETIDPPASDSVGVGTKDALAAMQSGKKYHLTADIEIDNTWTPLDLSDITLDGQGKTITVGAMSLFGTVTDLTAKQLKFAAPVVDGAASSIAINSTDYFFVAPLAQILRGNSTISKVDSTVSFDVSALNTSHSSYSNQNTVAGLVGYVEFDGAETVSFIDCSYSGNVSVSSGTDPYFVGGIVGYAKGNGGNSDTTVNRASLNFTNITVKGECIGKNSNTSGNNCFITAFGGVAGTVAVGKGILTTLENCHVEYDADLASSSSSGVTYIGHFGGLIGNSWGGSPEIHHGMINVSNSSYTGYFHNDGGMGAFTGGLIGKLDRVGVVFDTCSTSGTISCDDVAAGETDNHNRCVGGFVSELKTAPIAEFINCINGMKIYVSTYAETALGGFAGRITSSSKTLKMEGCTNNGSITVNGVLGDYTNGSTSVDLARLGGLVGYVYSLTGDGTTGENATPTIYVSNCRNNGAVSVTTANENVGGLFGNIDNITGSIVLNECINDGSITITTANDHIGGLVGEIVNVSGNLTISNCQTTANAAIKLDASNAVGGFSALIKYVSGDVSVTDCINGASISVETATHSGTGGFFSNITGPGSSSNRTKKVKIENCENKGSITCPGVLHNDTGGLGGSIIIYDTVEIINFVNTGAIDIGEVTRNIEVAGVLGAVEHITDGIMKNCKNYANLSIDVLNNTEGYSSFFGGLMGSLWCPSNNTVNFKIVGCENHGDLTIDTAPYQHCGFGGILANLYAPGDTQDATYTQNKNYIWSCVNFGNMTVKTSGNALHSGGIMGSVQRASFMDIRHCVNFGVLSTSPINSGWDDTGGILGGIMTVGDPSTMDWSNQTYSNFYIVDCHNMSSVSGNYVGGILGATWQIYSTTSHLTIEGCTNSGTVSGAGYAAGIFGCPDGAQERHTATVRVMGGHTYIKNCVNTGNVKSQLSAGIITKRSDLGTLTNSGNPSYGDGATYIAQGGKTEIINCSNSGKIESTTASYGISSGIISVIRGPVTIKKCSNTGELSTTGGGTAPICGTSAIPNSGASLTIGTGTDKNYYSAAGTVNATTSLDGTTSTAHGEANSTQATALFNNNKKSAYSYGTYSGYSYKPASAAQVNGHASAAQYILDSPDAVHLSSSLKTANVDRVLLQNIAVAAPAAGMGALDGGSLSGIMYLGYNTPTKYEITMTGSHVLGEIKNGGVLRDTNIKGVASSTESTAPVLVLNGGTIENVNVSAQLATTAGSLAGVAGTIAEGSTLKNVTFSGKLTTTNGVNGNIGGFASTLSGNANFINCSNAGATITSTGTGSAAHYGVGGWFGQIEDGVHLDGLINNCTISVADKGGIAASTSAIVYAPCVGGIAGHMKVVQGSDSFSITSCTNNATISGYCAGGIVGGACTDTRLQDKNAERNNATIVISDCTNNSAITGTAAAGGIIADTASIVGYKLTHDQTQAGGALMAVTTISDCINAGRVYTTESTEFTLGGATSAMIFTGGIVGVTDSAQISGCTNRGEVEGYQRTGGILGSRHNNLEKLVSVTNCINAGNVESSDYAGGIIGYIETSRVDITSCVNAGEVYSYAKHQTTPNECSAGGIVGAISGNYYTYAETVEMGIYIDIDKCVNAGIVMLYSGAGREYDSWSSVGGIVGCTTQGLSVTNCAHHGELYTNVGGKRDNPSSYSTHPILNCIEMRGREASGVNVAPEGDTTTKDYFNINNPDRLKDSGMYVVSGNVFLEGSVSREGFKVPEYYHFSTCVEDWELEEVVGVANVKFYSSAKTSELIDLAESLRDTENNYTAAQKTAIDTAVTNARALIASGAASQTAFVEQNRELRQAIYGYGDNGTSYIIVIPEFASADHENVIKITSNSTYFSSLTVDIMSANSFKLVDTKGNEIPYTIVSATAGVTTEKVDDVYTATYKKGTTATNGVFDYKFIPTLGSNSAPAGTYRDKVSFVVSYSSGKPSDEYLNGGN